MSNVDNRVEHPKHYNTAGVEVIEITKDLSFCRGNVVKYILRAGHKEEEGLTLLQKEHEDLKKAKWYLDYELESFENKHNLKNI